MIRSLRRGAGQGFRDLEAARRWLAGLPEVDESRFGVAGFCLGGGFALLYAVHAPVGRFIGFIGFIEFIEFVGFLGLIMFCLGEKAPRWKLSQEAGYFLAFWGKTSHRGAGLAERI